MPVSWQIGPWVSQAISMLLAITASAVPARDAGFSASVALVIARRTSGGRLVEVCVISSIKLSLNACIKYLREAIKMSEIKSLILRHKFCIGSVLFSPQRHRDTEVAQRLCELFTSTKELQFSQA